MHKEQYVLENSYVYIYSYVYTSKPSYIVLYGNYYQ